MLSFFKDKLESLVTEAGILYRAPTASAALTVMALAAGFASGWTVHSTTYTAALSIRDERINGLKEENDRLQKQNSEFLKAPVDPDAIFQGGAKIGTVERPYADIGNGKYFFGVVRTDGNFNPAFSFSYRGLKLKFAGTPSSSS